MRGIFGCLGASAVAGLVLLATVGQAADKADKIPLDKVPKKIMKAIEGRFPGAKLTSVEKEKEGDNIVYDIELKYKGRKYEMDIKEDGTIIEIEKEIPAKDLPRRVARALMTKYPKATTKEVMEVYKVKGKEEKLDHYEVLLVTGEKKEMEVMVSLDGMTIKGEKGEGEKK
jgi:hypothetical protein